MSNEISKNRISSELNHFYREMTDLYFYYLDLYNRGEYSPEDLIEHKKYLEYYVSKIDTLLEEYAKCERDPKYFPSV